MADFEVIREPFTALIFRKLGGWFNWPWARCQAVDSWRRVYSRRYDQKIGFSPLCCPRWCVTRIEVLIRVFLHRRKNPGHHIQHYWGDYHGICRPPGRVNGWAITYECKDCRTHVIKHEVRVRG